MATVPLGGRGGIALLGGEQMGGKTTEQLVAQYLRARRVAREHNAITQRGASYTLASFAKAVPADPKRIHQRHILRWLDQPGCTDATLATKYGTVRAFTRWASATGEIDKDPTFGITGPKRPRRIPRAVDPCDIELLLDTAPCPRLRAAESLMACEGLRISEVCRLQLGDIDWRTRTIRAHGKGDKERLVHLTPTTGRAIKAYLACHPVASGPLIRSFHDGHSPISTGRLGRLVSAHMAEIGIKAFPRDGKSPHALRHSYGSDLMDAGATITEVADLMGHESIQTTMVYQRRVDMERTRSLVEGRSYAGGLRSVGRRDPLPEAR